MLKAWHAWLDLRTDLPGDNAHLASEIYPWGVLIAAPCNIPLCSLMPVIVQWLRCQGRWPVRQRRIPLA